MWKNVAAKTQCCELKMFTSFVFSAPDQGRKRKQNGSSSSQESSEVQTSKRSKITVVRY